MDLKCVRVMVLFRDLVGAKPLSTISAGPFSSTYALLVLDLNQNECSTHACRLWNCPQ
jgi:hypothetical protein